MKRLMLIAVLVLLGVWQAFAQYPVISIRQLQEQPPDSLLLADALQGTQAARWTLQASPRMRHSGSFQGDTVTIVGLCVVPPRVLTFTGGGWTMLLYDTSGSPTPFGSVFVRATGDSASHLADGFLNVQRGWIIRMTGVVSEFPLNYNSLTQLAPIPGIPIVPLATGRPIPPPPTVTIDQFYNGLFSGGTVKYSTGEQYEGKIVQMVNLTLDSKVNTARGTFSMVDANGNQMTDYDASRFFTLGHGTIVGPPDSLWAIKYPAIGIGTRIDTIRGFITTVSGSESPRGYRISPIYRGDIVFGLVPLAVTTHRRNPVVVTPDSVARISAVVRKQTGGTGAATVSLLYSVNNGGWNTLPMTLSDTTYKANIPQQPADSFVKYFIKAVDSVGTSTTLASSALGAFGSDTSKGFFFYTSLNRPLTIRDIQYTPFVNGRSAYQGGTVSVSGVVTADTANIGRSPLGTGGTNAWYMQTGNQAWNGIWFADTNSTLLALRNGDSVKISGNVTENFDVTQIANFNAAPIVQATGRPSPTPVVLTSGTFGPTIGNGVPAAEQWEGMLIRLNNVVVADTIPTFADPTEFAVDDGSGPMLVRRDGRHRFSNVSADSATSGKTIVRQGQRISYLQGIVYYSFNRYKIVPRTNADWGTITSVDIDRQPGLPDVYSLAQNYPNPFNPSTTIEYNLPKSENVMLKVYNLLGQEVETLINQTQTAGKYTLRFDASRFSTGVYFYRLQAGQFSQIKKMLLIK